MEKEPVPTPQEIWKILKEVSQGQKEMDRLLEKSKRETDRRIEETDRRIEENNRHMRETDRLFRESKQEADRRMQETDRILRESKQETDRQMKETDRKMAELRDLFSNQWGKLVEALAEGSILRLMKDWGMDQVNRTIVNFPGRYKGQEREFDILVVNGDKMLVIEAKTTLKQKHVDYFLETMRDFKNYCPEYKALTVYAGVAYIKSSKEVLKYAERKGLFVVRSVGDNALLMNKPHFKPKVFA